MKKKYFSHLFIFPLIFAFLLFSPKYIFADNCWEEFQCNGGCKGELQKRTCCANDDETSCDSWIVEKTCQAWQMCKASPSASQSGCFCEGQCLETPKNPRYYNNPTYSDQPDKNEGPNNILLPVKFDWDDGFSPINSSEGFIYYKVTIDNTNKGVYSTVVNKSEYNYFNDENAGACLLKSGATHNWQVKACCNEDGTNCQEDAKKLQATFTTNPAPEPKLPYDPDWAGPNKAENLSIEEIEKLEWCEIDNPSEWQGTDGKTYTYYDTSMGGKIYYRPLSYKVLIYYKEGDNDVCHPNLKTENGCKEIILSLDNDTNEPFPPFQFLDRNHSFFTKNNSYSWKVAACKDTAANYCTNYSQLWRFKTQDFTLEKPKLTSPPNEKEIPVGLPVLISWDSPYATSWIYQISEIGQGKTDVSNISLDWPQLKLNTQYNWKVWPCWDFEGKECESFFAGPFYFKTTGRPPSSEIMNPEGENIQIPVNFTWENVPGAKSFIFKIQGDDLNLTTSIEKAEFSLGYPDLKQEKTYSWQIKTCAKEKDNDCVKNQTCCGDWSQIKTFQTFKLSAPSAPLVPSDNETIFTYQMPMSFSWEPVSGAKYYKYTITYTSKSPDEVSEECIEGTKQEKIVSSSSDFISLNCLGDYEWQVITCLDENCQESGDQSLWRYKLFQAESENNEGEIKSSLVPCGRNVDDPNTPWNERESCQIKHFFIMIFKIIDFFLWKIVPIVLILLIIASGIIFYFSLQLEGTEPLIKIKSLWKATAIGCGIVFLAWTIVSFVLNLFNYQTGIFGPWWKFPL